MYPTNDKNWTYVQDNRQVAEMKIQDNAVEEHLVVKNSNNPFFSNYVWTSRTIGQNITSTLHNYLQPATAHLDVSADFLPTSWSGDPFGLTPAVPGDDVANTGYFDVKGAVENTALPYSSMVGGTLTVNTAWNRNVYALSPNTQVNGVTVTRPNDALPGVFLWAQKDYNDPATPLTGADDQRDYSFTNVAKYVMQDDEVILSSASKVYQDVNGNCRR